MGFKQGESFFSLIYSIEPQITQKKSGLTRKYPKISALRAIFYLLLHTNTNDYSGSWLIQS